MFVRFRNKPHDQWKVINLLELKHEQVSPFWKFELNALLGLFRELVENDVSGKLHSSN